ncbi:hypothetical protein RHMOL_Rhmol03G0173100 [Rhododendron molle]|uniref:Uncharacterized protein n=1 Tax=Rhododendron molle TaxID=49168 RepID=A0ACC0PGY6_RHOML|nr:hypothetical protein RHMOL_Rhmol03G0173100 [Rhododendron molle]
MTTTTTLPSSPPPPPPPPCRRRHHHHNYHNHHHNQRHHHHHRRHAAATTTTTTTTPPPQLRHHNDNHHYTIITTSTTTTTTNAPSRCHHHHHNDHHHHSTIIITTTTTATTMQPPPQLIVGSGGDDGGVVVAAALWWRRRCGGDGGGGGGGGDVVVVAAALLWRRWHGGGGGDGFANALKWVKEMKDMEEEMNDKLTFLGSFVTSFRDQTHTDIQVKPGNNGPPIPAHRALLASRSEILKNVLDSDGCKAPPNDNTITLPELDHEELDALLEFLYTGTLPKEKAEKHVYSLSIAADKYDIPFLHKFCEHRMLGSLNSLNALDVLEISDLCSNQGLKETALNFIVKNMEDVVFSARFDAFALKNPHLTVQITRASFMDIKSRRNIGV